MLSCEIGRRATTQEAVTAADALLCRQIVEGHQSVHLRDCTPLAGPAARMAHMPRQPEPERALAFLGTGVACRHGYCRR
jgi:hypothetical protein